MAGFSINESLFIVDMDDDSITFMERGEHLPVGITVGEERDRGEKFTFYVSEDGRFDILAVKSDLALRWVEDGYLPRRALMPHQNGAGEIDFYLLISPASRILSRMTDVRVYGSPYYANLVASAMWHTRYADHDINLRDGILCELFGVVLPTYSLTPVLADVAVFANALRSRYEDEDLRGRGDFADGTGGLNRFTFAETLRRSGMETSAVEPYFEVGECIDDMVVLDRSDVSITGPLELNEHYQIFSTDTDLAVLALSDAWAGELFERELVMQMDFKPMLLGHTRIWLRAYGRAPALENLSRRHYGVTASEVFDLALALNRMRKKNPTARTENALYVQESGLVLPVVFEGGGAEDDALTLRDVASAGPFAQGEFMEDVLSLAEAAVRA